MSDESTAIGPDEILRRLPHRYPFLMVDRAESYVPGESIVGFKCVSAAEPHFQGHFPKTRSCPAC